VILNTRPTIVKVNGTTGDIFESLANFAWFGEDEDGTVDHYLYSLDEGPWQVTVGNTFTWSGFSVGEHVFSIKAVDDLGSQSSVISWTFVYEDPMVTFRVFSASPQLGRIKIGQGAWITDESTILHQGSEVEVSASALDGATFEGWFEGGEKITEQNPIQFTVYQNRTIYAVFSEETTGPVVKIYNVNCAASQGFEIVMNAKGFDSLLAFDILIQYDPQVMEPLDEEPDFVTLSGSASALQFLKRDVVQPGLIWISAGSLGNAVSISNEDFLTVRMGAMDITGVYSLGFGSNTLFLNGESQLIDVVLSQGILTVE